MIIPNIIEKNIGSEKIYDLYSKLLNSRIIMLSGEVNDDISSLIISELLYLDSINHEDIYLYINSPGGSVSSGLGIYDTINYIKSDVVTVGIGLCASMGAVLLASGTKGKRYSLPNTEIMIHEVLSGYDGRCTDIQIHAQMILDTKKKLNKILASLTNNNINKINKDTQRDYYLDANDALKYGIIDAIL